ncbi:SWI-SNF complex subunit [Sporormia fimetaria CBS 119925]|uniref:SWI-SNF complex subunit n=1 Tax=Sporormia fimetaria CBS 119925 TaxID=1340428 RepID=A0A6A6VJ69_9PLEO|nr:SWI-SNF complex subunit [Sporormia fimetaria CBS 119925]
MPGLITKADLDYLFRQAGPIPPQHPPPPQHYTTAHMQAQQRAEAERREKMRRLALTPTDRNIPDGVEDICIGDGVARYRELQEVERTMDAMIMRKKLEVADSIYHPRAPVWGTMRVWISNTAENQPWQSTDLDPETFDFDTGTSATYRVKIQGRLLDENPDVGLEDDDEEEKDADAMDEDSAEASKTTTPPKPTVFSQFFSSITIDFDRAKSLQPDNFTQIEWKRPENAAAKDANFTQLEFERKSDENINVTINLHRHLNPDRFRLSKGLSELLDQDEDDRAGIMMKIWEYARAEGLQSDEDDRKFACDAQLKALFNQDMFYFPNLPHLLKPHMMPVPPIQLPYTIRVDKPYIAPSPDSGIQPSAPTVYDVRVQLPDPLRPYMDRVLRSKDNIESLEQIRAIDEQIALIMTAISQSKAKHAFFTNMAKDPVNFLKRWLSSQKRDLEVILGEASRGGGEDASGAEWWRGGDDGVWNSEVAKESVGLWLARSGMMKAGGH